MVGGAAGQSNVRLGYGKASSPVCELFSCFCAGSKPLWVPSCSHAMKCAAQDVGVFAAYFLNVVALQPGQAMYLPANEPHAYVSGQMVEAMATSDNVIRAGLTPKLRDTTVLCSSLTYSQVRPRPIPPCASACAARMHAQRLAIQHSVLALVPSPVSPQGLPRILEGEAVSEAVLRYAPPFDEFEVRLLHPILSGVHASRDFGLARSSSGSISATG